MKVPEKYKKIILTEKNPKEIYRRCLSEMAQDKIQGDSPLTEAVVYAAEVLYALDILKNGKPKAWKNFADQRGDADQKLWSVLDEISSLQMAFVGSGPYPVTAFQVLERYPRAKVTCIDNHVVGYLLGKGVSEKAGMDISFLLEEAINVDYGPFNVVLVTAMVHPKEKLVEKILRTSKTKVIIRGSLNVSHERLVQFPLTPDEEQIFRTSKMT